MTADQPNARRPIAKIFRRTAYGATQICLRLGISANAISIFSIVPAIAAAFCFLNSFSHPWLLLIAPVFCALRLWCNMLDGMVALAGGSASRPGEIFNELPDRVSDVVIFAGATQSGLMNPIFGYWAIIFSLGTAYVGTLAQAIGASRQFAGLMSKPLRMVVLGIGAWITYALICWNEGGPELGHRFALDWTCLIIVLGCVQTIAVRLRRIFRAVN